MKTGGEDHNTEGNLWVLGIDGHGTLNLIVPSFIIQLTHSEGGGDRAHGLSGMESVRFLYQLKARILWSQKTGSASAFPNQNHVSASLFFFVPDSRPPTADPPSPSLLLRSAPARRHERILSPSLDFWQLPRLSGAATQLTANRSSPFVDSAIPTAVQWQTGGDWRGRQRPCNTGDSDNLVQAAAVKQARPYKLEQRIDRPSTPVSGERTPTTPAISLLAPASPHSVGNWDSSTGSGSGADLFRQLISNDILSNWIRMNRGNHGGVDLEIHPGGQRDGGDVRMQGFNNV
ncbi:unnamed protein product [Cuscuta campestris]|uniref:Uncharacterized protein n=1 Tax=Cuscuta campestris TaxID=132261 RepID=A0A484NKN9_9ASTE|nr:unnamed protein product [Cuscuta campestris]